LILPWSSVVLAICALFSLSTIKKAQRLALVLCIVAEELVAFLNPLIIKTVFIH